MNNTLSINRVSVPRAAYHMCGSVAIRKLMSLNFNLRVFDFNS